ncbi:MAG: leucine-rich repeat protein [Bacteroidetes bacterium]|nr:leucine-rich repeat protein [Bacteroidota bacterium]
MNRPKLFLRVLAFTGLSMSANAQTTVVASGDCGANGNNLTWELTSDSVFTISGSGAMYNYSRTFGEDTLPVWSDAIYRNLIKTVIIENTVTTIGDYAFTACSKLASVTIPNSITAIGESAFQFCSRLTSVIIPDSVITIGKDAFGNCSNLTSMIIGNSVTTIGEAAFSSCSNLTSIIMGNSVTMIGNNVFSSCSKLTEITIPKSVKTIGGFVFVYCTSLTTVNFNADSCISMGANSWTAVPFTTVNIGNNVKRIPENAFIYCSQLTSVILPNSVITIGNSAFSYCTGLTFIRCEATNPPKLGTNVFFKLPADIPVYIPCQSYGSYTNASGWRDFTNFVSVGITINVNDTACIGEPYLKYGFNIQASQLQTAGNFDFQNLISHPTGCDTTVLLNLLVLDCTGIEELTIDSKPLTIYPNPASGRLTILNEQLTANNVEIYDIYGRNIVNSRLSIDNSIDISHLANGIYFLKIGNKRTKFVKN